MKKNFLQTLSAAISRHRACPHCHEGKARLSRAWFIDVEVQLKCSHCKALLARINYVCTALLLATMLTSLYVIFQRLGVHHSIAQSARITAILALPMLILLELIRLLLLWLLWRFKHSDVAPRKPISASDARAAQPSDDEWWRPFVEQK